MKSYLHKKKGSYSNHHLSGASSETSGVYIIYYIFLVVLCHLGWLGRFKKKQLAIYPPKKQHDNGKSTIWRCTSYWTWGFSNVTSSNGGFSIVMLVFGGVDPELGMLPRKPVGSELVPYVIFAAARGPWGEFNRTGRRNGRPLDWRMACQKLLPSIRWIMGFFKGKIEVTGMGGFLIFPNLAFYDGLKVPQETRGFPVTTPSTNREPWKMQRFSSRCHHLLVAHGIPWRATLTNSPLWSLYFRMKITTFFLQQLLDFT